MYSATPVEKARIRQELISARRRLSPELRTAYSRRIAKRLYDSASWQQASSIFCYIGTGWEVETESILRTALLEGRRVGVPLCLADGIMEARELLSWDALVPGAFHIPEPRHDAPFLAPETFDLAIIPAVAFDRDGYRLGRGGGYYDRYLTGISCEKMGLCFDQFLLPSVPCEEHDVRMDRILTEEGDYQWT